ncbi:FAD-dependent monooxygenase [Flavihumibacter cheonanensis]
MPAGSFVKKLDMQVAIVGGGIGGLTTALVLKNANIPFTLYEAASEIRQVGAGIILASNAMQVLAMYGIDQLLYSKGHRIENMLITDAGLGTLSQFSLKGFEQQYGLQNLAIHRAHLHEILWKEVGGQQIKLNKRLHSVSRNGTNFELSFEDGSTSLVTHIIGADGIKSKVRELLFPAVQYRSAKQLCWRGVLNYELPASYKHGAIEAWGKGKRMGFVQINEQEVYWYAVINEDMVVTDQPMDLPALFREFHPIVMDLLDQTSPDKLIRGPLYDIQPFTTWNQSRVCLLGDAAHATTPNLGQGACQAIEDAFVLGELLKTGTLEQAMKRYPAIRMRKAHYVVNTSWQLGKISHLTNPVGMGLRNFVLKYLTPDFVNRRQLDKLFKLDTVN